MCEGRRRAESLKKTSDGLAPLALFETIAAQFAPNPLVQALELKSTRRMAVEVKPSSQKRVELGDHLRQTHPTVATGNLFDLLLGALDAFGRDSEFAVQQQPMAEELSFSDRSDGALFPVHPEMQLPFQEPYHDSITRCPAASDWT